MSNYKLVPVEPAEEMLRAACDEEQRPLPMWTRMKAIYAAALAEAPIINIVATKNEQGQIVSVTLQDEDHRILEVIAEADVQGELVGYIRRSALELMKNDELGVRANIIKEPRYQDCVALYTTLQPAEQHEVCAGTIDGTPELWVDQFGRRYEVRRWVGSSGDQVLPLCAAPQPTEPDEERLAMEAVMESVDPATWPGLTTAQRCALGRFTKPQPAEQQPLPCKECGGDGAGGEHEEDCSMAQPIEIEAHGSYPVSGQIFFRESSNEWVLELTGSANGTTFTARHTQPADTRPEDVAGLPALYEPTPDVTELVEALENIRDYWNRDPNEYAMSDALWHIIAVADAALATHRKQ